MKLFGLDFSLGLNCKVNLFLLFLLLLLFFSPHSGQHRYKMASISDQSLQMFSALKVDQERMCREFFTPEPISMTGNYYPRPCYNYKVPSKYGFSKYITVRKL